MNTLKNLALTALLAVAAVGCKNDSPTPQNVVVKPVEPTVLPTVLPNEKCYAANIIDIDPCGNIVAQVEYDSIGVRAELGYHGILNNIITLRTTNYEILNALFKLKKVYFTASKITDVDSIKVTSACNTANIIIYPCKFAIISSYSSISCNK